MSKIVRFEAHNFMGLDFVQIEPDGNLVIINGENGSGKSSLLQGIWALLASTAGLKNVDKPIREGESSAVLSGTIMFDNGDGLVVTRTFRDGKDMKIKVTNLDGSVVHNSAETMLKKFISKLSFDPLAFANMKPKEQVEFYMRAVCPDLDLDELNVARASVFDKRTEANREAERAKHTLESLPETAAKASDVEVSAADILRDQERAQAIVAKNAEAARRLQELHEKLRQAANRELLARAEVDDAVAERERLETVVASAETAFGTPETVPDMTGFAEQIAAIEATNAEIRTARTREAHARDMNAHQQAALELSVKLDEIDQRKRDAIAATPSIVDGLTFDDEQMILNGVPLKQASGAEQLLASVMVGINLKPEVRVMTVTEGPLLDDKSMALLAEIAAEHDYDIWVERVGGADDGFTISEGRVVGQPGGGDMSVFAKEFAPGFETGSYQELRDFDMEIDPMLDEADHEVYSDEEIAEMDMHADEQSRQRQLEEEYPPGHPAPGAGPGGPFVFPEARLSRLAPEPATYDDPDCEF